VVELFPPVLFVCFLNFHFFFCFFEGYKGGEAPLRKVLFLPQLVFVLFFVAFWGVIRGAKPPLLIIAVYRIDPHAPSGHQMTMKTGFNTINLRETIIVYPFSCLFFQCRRH